MGATFQEMEMEGDVLIADMKTRFIAVQDKDRYENGHMYSGGFGMATGLITHQEPVYSTPDEAREWLIENAHKWREAHAVRFQKTPEEVCWMIGAWCAE
jgi:hypothetical protein